MPTLPGMLRTTAHAFPDRPAITCEGRTTTFGELDAQVDRLAAELIDRGVAPGDRIVIVEANSDAFAVAVLASLRTAAIVVPVNPKSAGGEIEHFVTDSGAETLLFGPGCAEAVTAWTAAHPGTASAVRTLCLGPGGDAEDVIAATSAREAREIEPDIAEDDDAVIIYTSGTTGRPKGALFDHHRIIWVGINATIALGLRMHDRILHVAPLYHSAALHMLFFPGLMLGAHQFIHSAFDPEAVLAAFEEHRISVFFGVPTMFAFLVRSPSLGDRDTSALRVAVFGAAPMPGSLAERLFDAFPHTEIVQACGQTEGGPGGVILPHEEVKRTPSASGRYPLPNTEVRVVDAEGRDVAPGEVGEMIMRGETMMKEYWGRPAVTAETVVDGWVHTGDLAHVDSEGIMSLVDRLKDMIISGGRNIYSAEVENALAAYPEIVDIAIIARPHPDWGESDIAVVAPADGGNPTLEGLQEFARPLLSSYKIPRELVVGEIPRTPSGKIQKHKLRERTQA